MPLIASATDTPTDDPVVRASVADAGKSAFHALAIADLRRETDDAVSIAFAIPAPLAAMFAFRPGQYLTLRAVLGGEDIRRAYSICSGADEPGRLRIAVKRAEGGLFSTHANHALQTGDRIDVMPPAGRFGPAMLHPEQARVHLAIAAGSGITPILAILRAVLAGESHSRCVLLYGSRTTRDILLRGALEDLKDRYLGRLSVTHVLSREAQDLGVLNGRLDGSKLRGLIPAAIDPARVDAAYICGPGDMVAGARATLTAFGVAEARIQSELFSRPDIDGAPMRPRLPPTASAVGGDTAVATARITHDGKTVTVAVAEGEAVLDAALRAGLDLPWSCRAGMCSTCRARLTEGTVAMTQNFSLEAWELEAGFVLTCQAHPTSQHLAIDYDQV